MQFEMPRDVERKEERTGSKKGELHELPYTERVKSCTIRLVSPQEVCTKLVAESAKVEMIA